MRQNGIVSARQQRLEQLKPSIESVRQKAVISLSERTKMMIKKTAKRIAKRGRMTYDEAVVSLVDTHRRSSEVARRRNPRPDDERG